MQRKRKLDEIASESPVTNLSTINFFTARSLGFIKRSMTLSQLKIRVAYCLGDDVKDFVNAVLLCEEIFNLTRLRIDMKEFNFNDASLPIKTNLNQQFTCLIDNYSLDSPTPIDFVEYSALANDIIYALLQQKKYLLLRKLLDRQSLFTVLQVKNFLTELTNRNFFHPSHSDIEELVSLRNLFKARCVVLFNLKQPPVQAYSYYFLYVSAEHGLGNIDSLNIENANTDSPLIQIEAEAYLKLIRALKIYDEIQLDLGMAYLHEDFSLNSDEQPDDDNELGTNPQNNDISEIPLLKQRIIDECYPLLTPMLSLAIPLASFELVSLLELNYPSQKFWLQLSLFQGNIFKSSDTLQNLFTATLIELKKSNPSRFNESFLAILGIKELLDLNRGELLTELIRLDFDKDSIQCLLAMHALMTTSKFQVQRLIEKMNVTAVNEIKPRVGN